MIDGILVVLVIVVICFVLINNRLVSLKNGVETAFSTIDVYLKKRYDLIPNLVNITKSYMEYEKETLEHIVELRNSALNGGMSERINKDAALSKDIGKIMVLSENYPELKASESFQSLSDALVDVEAEIGAGRRAYNASVKNYNVGIEQFPFSIVANILGYNKYPYFEIEDSQRENIKVDI